MNLAVPWASFLWCDLIYKELDPLCHRDSSVGICYLFSAIHIEKDSDRRGSCLSYN